MATLWITEFSHLGQDHARRTGQTALLPPVAEQSITITAGSTQGSALNSATHLVRLHTDTACHIAVGTNPTASSANLKMLTDSTEYFAVTPGDVIAVITA